MNEIIAMDEPGLGWTQFKKSVVSQEGIQAKSLKALTNPCGAIDNAVDISVNEILAMYELNSRNQYLVSQVKSAWA